MGRDMGTDISTASLEAVFVHLECVDCAEEAALFRLLAKERDELLAELSRRQSNEERP